MVDNFVGQTELDREARRQLDQLRRMQGIHHDAHLAAVLAHLRLILKTAEARRGFVQMLEGVTNGK
jgi:hypothetical protein